MTCIAGAIKNGEVWMGGDAVSVQGTYGARVGAWPKVFRVGEFLVGSSGTLRVRQAVEFLFEPPLIDGDLYAYMVRRFVPPLQLAVKEAGGELKDPSRAGEIDGDYLIGVRGRLFRVDCGYGILELAAPYAAIGCADQEATSAMFTASALVPDISGHDLIERALLAAAEFDLAIRPPFTILKL